MVILFQWQWGRGEGALGGTSVKHAGDVRVVHERQRLPFGLEARQHLAGVHAELDDLEGHAAADRFLLLGHPDGAHAAFTNLFEKFVAADAVAGLFGRSADGLVRSMFLNSRGCSGWGQPRSGFQFAVFKEFPGAVVSTEQALEPRQHGRIIATGFAQISIARLRGFDAQSLLENGFFAFGRHTHGLEGLCGSTP